MAFRQTKDHKPGKHSYHQICCFTGQPMGEFDKDLDRLLAFMGNEADLDGVELSSWDLDLRRADNDADAETYATELFEQCNDHGLDIVSIAAHLQGQCLGDRATLKTIQFQGGDIVAAYEEWLKTNDPPEDNPYFVPEDVAKMSRELAVKDHLAVGRLAQYIGATNGRNVPVSGFIGSAGAWDDIFAFPPPPAACGSKLKIGNRADFAAGVIINRFAPIWDDYRNRGVKFGIESHPTELCAGDIKSTRRFLGAAERAGFKDVVGLNFDASHLLWQDVNPCDFIEEFQDCIWSLHHKGVQVRSDRRAKAGVLGGWESFGSPSRYWDFVYASSDRDSTNPEEIIALLNRVGWDGAITIECEDNDFQLRACMVRAAKLLREIDLPPAGAAFDAAFAKE